MCLVAHSGFIERIRKRGEPLQKITPELDRPVRDWPELFLERLDLATQCGNVHSRRVTRSDPYNAQRKGGLTCQYEKRKRNGMGTCAKAQER